MNPSNETCCLNREGIRVTVYHNPARIPTIAEAWTTYYEDAGYTLPTTMAGPLTTASSFSRNKVIPYTSTTLSRQSHSLIGVTTSSSQHATATSTSEAIDTSTPNPAITPREKAIVGTASAVGGLGLLGAVGSVYLFRRSRKRLDQLETKLRLERVNPKYTSSTEQGVLREMDATWDRPLNEAHLGGLNELERQDGREERVELPACENSS